MKTRTGILCLAGMVLCPIIYATSARDAWFSLVTGQQQQQEAFAFVENDPDLPNVLIYGDSISIGYTPRVRERLDGRANVYRLHTNGGDSASFVGKMELMHKTMRDRSLDDPWSFEWDVIHFNVGLHDLKYIVDGKLDKVNGEQVSSTGTYRKNLGEIIAYLKQLAPRARLVFATTTPVPEGEPGRHAGDAARYNKVALQVLAQHPDIRVNDLYGFVMPRHAEWWSSPGNVHYNDSGKDAQGDEVAEAILDALE